MRNKNFIEAVVAISVALICSATASAKSAEKISEHEDLFGEQQLQVGVKAGPQVTHYTNYTVNGVEIQSQSTLRPSFGIAAKFIYELPRFEVGVYFSGRSAVNSADSYFGFAVPLLLKFPLSLDRGVDFELGAGYQPEYLMFGRPDHRTNIASWLGTLGLSFDLSDYIFDVETRYMYGINEYSGAVQGAKNRDLQILIGFLWRI